MITTSCFYFVRIFSLVSVAILVSLVVAGDDLIGCSYPVFASPFEAAALTRCDSLRGLMTRREIFTPGRNLDRPLGEDPVLSQLRAGPPGWGFEVRLTAPPCNKDFVSETPTGSFNLLVWLSRALSAFSG